MRIGLIIYGELETLSGGYLYDRMLVRQLRARADDVAPISLPWRNYARHLGDNLWAGLVQRCRALELDLLLQDELNHPSLFRVNRQLKREVGAPLVSIVHHLRSDEQHPAAAMMVYRRVERAYLNSVDGFIFNSATTRRAVTALLSREKPGLVAHPAADHIAPPAADVVAELAGRRCAEAGPLRVLAVGNVIERKNLHTLIAALAHLPATDWTLTVAGSLTTDPVYVARLRAQIDAARIDPEQVIFTGGVDDAQLRRLYGQSHLLALPSFEGFGIVYLEAMSFGCAPIASTAGAAREIITDGVDGILVNPGDEAELAARIAELHKDRNRLFQMSLAARRRYDRHPTWAATMDRATSWLHEIDWSATI